MPCVSIVKGLKAFSVLPNQSNKNNLLEPEQKKIQEERLWGERTPAGRAVPFQPHGLVLVHTYTIVSLRESPSVAWFANL